MKLKEAAPYFLVAIITIMAITLRVYALDEKSLFGDEWLSVRDSEYIHLGGQPPFFFLILRIFLGTNDFVLRLPAVIFGVSTIPLCYYIGKLFFGTKEGLVGAFLLSISWAHIYYSQLVRMYSLFVFLCLFSLIFFYKCFCEGEEKGKRRGRSRVRLERNRIWLCVGFIVSTVLGLYTHFFAFCVVAVEIVYFGLMMIYDYTSTRGNSLHRRRVESKRRKKIFLLFVLSNAAIFALFSPVMKAMWSEFSGVAGVDGGNNNSVRMLDLSFLTKSFTWFSNTGGVLWSSSIDGLALFMYVAFFICGLLLSVTKSKKQIVLLSIWVALPILLTYLLSTRMFVQSQPRYVIFILPIYLIVISRGIIGTAELVLRARARITTRFLRESGMSLAVLSIILMVFSYSSIPGVLGYYNRPDDENWRGVAQYLEREWQPNDFILLEPVWNRGPFLYYYHTNPSDSVLTPTSLSEIEGICKHNRVWFVYPYNSRAAFDKDKEIWYWLHQNSDSVFNPGGIDVFFLSPEEQPLFKTGIFLGSRADWAYTYWISTILSMNTSVRVFDESTAISSSILLEFDAVFFIDFGRALGNLERQTIKESIEKGLVVNLIGLSPYYIAGGSHDITSISSWFGATHFSEAPKEARWKVKFTENATDILSNIDLDDEYEFYTSSDWSTPTGCTVNPNSVIYAYRVDDQAGAIFSHKFGNGTSIFDGARYGYNSKDAETWRLFLQALVQSTMYVIWK